MSGASFISHFIAINLILAVTIACGTLLPLLLQACGCTLAHRAVLKFQSLLFGLAVIGSVAGFFLPTPQIFAPPVRIWAAPSSAIFVASNASAVPAMTTIAKSEARALPWDKAGEVVLGLLAVLMLVALAQLFREGRDLRRLARASYAVRRIGRVCIYANDALDVPLAFWQPGCAAIVIPSRWLATPQTWRAIVLHELQHHRQGDTRWTYAYWLLSRVFVFHPLVRGWSRWISELQELACDEALVDQGKVESLAYARCLVEVAETANVNGGCPVGATGLIFERERNGLKRRITSMIRPQKKFGSKMLWPLMAAALIGISATTYASQNLVQDRRLSLADAQRMSATGGDFPVVVNDLVVKWLNYYLATPDGRVKVKAALARLNDLRGSLTAQLHDYQVPEDLLAIPLVESGYQNLTPSQNPVHAAGLWQFIASTAVKFGLQVDDQVDQRLDVRLETDAAMRLLLANKLRFSNWSLGILAYNAGDENVQAAIDKTGSRDPWVLVREGFTSREASDYLPRLMAAILILRNPEIAN